MKLAKHEFRQLQEKWYQKLLDSGFKDHEFLLKKGDFALLEEPIQEYCRRDWSLASRTMKEEYFRWVAREALDEETVYRNDADRHILTRHAEGARIKIIVKELETMNMPRDRGTIRFIIRRYEMEWGLKRYNDRQLHKKKA